MSFRTVSQLLDLRSRFLDGQAVSLSAAIVLDRTCESSLRHSEEVFRAITLLQVTSDLLPNVCDRLIGILDRSVEQRPAINTAMDIDQITGKSPLTTRNSVSTIRFSWGFLVHVPEHSQLTDVRLGCSIQIEVVCWL